MCKKVNIAGKMGLVLIYLLLTLLPTCLFSQYAGWINYTNGEGVNALAIEGDKIWIGTSAGLVVLDTQTDSMVFYNHSNSGLPDNNVRAIAIDGAGNKWIGTWGGGLRSLTVQTGLATTPLIQVYIVIGFIL